MEMEEKKKTRITNYLVVVLKIKNKIDFKHNKFFMNTRVAAVLLR